MDEKRPEEELERLQAQQMTETKGYKPRPKWQLVYAWILIAILLAGIGCTIYWLVFAPQSLTLAKIV